MTPEKLNEIRQRVSVMWRGWFTKCREDNIELLAEVDRLSAEYEGALLQWENERAILKSDNERLRAKLRRSGPFEYPEESIPSEWVGQ